jgi:hypothetical protein
MSKKVTGDECRVTRPAVTVGRVEFSGDRPDYIMDLEDIVRMRDLEVRGLKERVAELEQKVAACGDGAILAGKWRAVARAIMEIADGGWRKEGGR